MCGAPNSVLTVTEIYIFFNVFYLAGTECRYSILMLPVPYTSHPGFFIRCRMVVTPTALVVYNDFGFTAHFAILVISLCTSGTLSFLQPGTISLSGTTFLLTTHLAPCWDFICTSLPSVLHLALFTVPHFHPGSLQGLSEHLYHIHNFSVSRTNISLAIQLQPQASSEAGMVCSDTPSIRFLYHTGSNHP